MATTTTFDLLRQINTVLSSSGKDVYILNISKTKVPDSLPAFVCYISPIEDIENDDGLYRKKMYLSVNSYGEINSNDFLTAINTGEILMNELISLLENEKNSRFYNTCIKFEMTDELPPTTIAEDIVCVGRSYKFEYLENRKINLDYLT